MGTKRSRWLISTVCDTKSSWKLAVGLDDRGEGRLAGWRLVLGATRHEDPRIARDAGDDTAERGTGMTFEVDVRVRQHRGALAADRAVGRRGGLGEHRRDPSSLLSRREAVELQPSVPQAGDDRLDIDGVAQRRMCDPEVACRR